MSSSADRFDFAIVGGGLVGGAIGFGLARRARTVVVLDEGDLAHRAARGNFGLVWVQGKGCGLAAYANWTQASARRWPELSDLLRDAGAVDVALEQRGGFHVCLTREELAEREALLSALVAQDGVERYPFEILEHDALAARLPGLGPQVAGASYCPLDGHVNPLRLLRALHAAIVAEDGVCRSCARVETVEALPGGGYALSTPTGRIEADRVVLAAGLGNASLAAAAGLAAPVRPQRGEILVLERQPRFLAHPTASLRQTDEGTVLIGDSEEEVGFDDGVDVSVLSSMAMRAVRTFPRLAAARINRAWGALRVMSPDGFPIYEQSETMPGVFLTTCHSGVTLAAAHALILAPWIDDGALPSELAPFSAGRFDVRAAA